MSGVTADNIKKAFIVPGLPHLAYNRPGWEPLKQAMAKAGQAPLVTEFTSAPDAEIARLERAIGVIYRPETERQSHYFEADLCRQFDLLLHFDDTRAVKPLELTAGWHAGELPEAYPTGV